MYDVSDVDVGVYECIADNGKERATAEAKFSLRELPVQTVVAPSQSSQSSQPSSHLASQSSALSLPNAASQTASVVLIFLRLEQTFFTFNKLKADSNESHYDKSNF